MTTGMVLVIVSLVGWVATNEGLGERPLDDVVGPFGIVAMLVSGGRERTSWWWLGGGRGLE